MKIYVASNFPACIPCNIDKGCESLEDWRTWLSSRIFVSLRRQAYFRHAERFGRVIVVQEPLLFWFERYRAESVIDQATNG